MNLSWWRKSHHRKVKAPLTVSRRVLSRFFRCLLVEPLEDRTLPSTFQWVGGSSTNWNDAGNWNLLSGSGTFPNAPGDVARFNASYSTAQTVTVNQAITVGEIDFGTTRNVTIAASGSNVLTLDNTGTAANAVLDVGQAFTNSGVDVIAAPLVVNVATPLLATITGGTLQL